MKFNPSGRAKTPWGHEQTIGAFQYGDDLDGNVGGFVSQTIEMVNEIAFN